MLQISLNLILEMKMYKYRFKQASNATILFRVLFCMLNILVLLYDIIVVGYRCTAVKIYLVYDIKLMLDCVNGHTTRSF